MWGQPPLHHPLHLLLSSYMYEILFRTPQELLAQKQLLGKKKETVSVCQVSQASDQGHILTGSLLVTYVPYDKKSPVLWKIK